MESDSICFRKGEEERSSVVLDRVFHPGASEISNGELQVHISGDEKVSLPDTQLNDTVFMQENMEQLFKAYEDSRENWNGRKDSSDR